MIKDAFRLLRTAGPGLRQAGREGLAVFTTVTRLDGAFGTRGLALEPRPKPVSGGLAGLAKTAGHEWPEVACKAIDIEPAFAHGDVDLAVQAILDELVLPGPGGDRPGAQRPIDSGAGPDGSRWRCLDAQSGRRGRDQRRRRGGSRPRSPSPWPRCCSQRSSCSDAAQGRHPSPTGSRRSTSLTRRRSSGRWRPGRTARQHAVDQRTVPPDRGQSRDHSQPGTDRGGRVEGRLPRG